MENLINFLMKRSRLVLLLISITLGLLIGALDGDRERLTFERDSERDEKDHWHRRYLETIESLPESEVSASEISIHE